MWRAKLTPRRVEWKRPIEAIEAWADQSLVDRKNEEFERWIGLCHDWEVTQSKLGKMASDEPRPLLRQSEAYGRLKEQSHHRLRQIWNDLRLDMERKLIQGELIARGAPASASSDADETTIKRREWRKLVLDAKGERAMEKNGDPGSVRYEALMIGNKKH